ncbi:hypothetical protein ANO14919_137490 [Xylariales sp. No.14919]|nr:hypothetical protein ANO14919_137490 [Xylariales sp. No.14919]
MLYMLHPLSFALLGLSFLLLRRLNSRASQQRPSLGTWAELDAVGASPVNKVSFFGAVARSVVSTPDFVNEGYRRYSKGFARPFVLPTTWMRGGAVMVLPPSLVPLLTRPDKMSACEWRNIYGLVENIQLPYGTQAEWETINGWEACGRVISRSSQRILFGLPLSRDEALLETSRNYATSLLVGGAIINCFPPPVRWLAGPIVALRAKYFQSRFVKVLEPVVEERIRQWGADEDGGPDDFLQWLIPICAKEGPSQLDARRIALRLVSLLIPLIFAICYVFAHCVFDILGSPARSDVLAGLEEECTRVFAQHTTGLASSEAINELFRVDSALRESMRMSGVSVTNLFRDVATGELDNIHLDPDDYENPQEYDALRFSRPFEDAKGRVEERELVTTTTPTFLPFSYGRHACPGRWFAAQVMKQALAYIVQNYNVELVGEVVKRMALVNAIVPPVNTQIKIQRKK